MNEAEAIRDKLSSLTKAPFEVGEPKPDYPVHSRGKPRWLVDCPDAAYHGRVAHAHTAWEDVQDDIWLESSILNFISEWVDMDHGEEAWAKFSHMESHTFSDASFRKQFAKDFPVTTRRLKNYERIVSDVSSRRGVRIRILYDDSDSNRSITVTMAAEIEAKGMDLQSKLKAIEKNERALKEAYQEIAEYSPA